MNRNNEFLYKQVADDLRTYLETIPPDSKIDSRSLLVKKYKVARATIDKAIECLIAQGLLISYGGRGTYTVGRVHRGEYSYFGAILPNIVNFGYPAILKGIEDEANRHGLSMTVCTTDWSTQKLNDHVEKLVSSKVRGIVIVPNIKNSFDNRWQRLLTESGIPFGFCNRAVEDLDAPAVLLNNFYGSFMVTKHMIEQGYKKILFLSSPIYSTIRERLQGYLSCLLENGIEYSNDWIWFSKNHEITDEFEAGVEYLLEHHPDADAIICAGDLIANFAIESLFKRGYNVPGDIAVAGFDNSYICNNPYCNITSVDFNYYDMGEMACKLVLSTSANKPHINTVKTMHLTKPKLVIRESTVRQK